MAKTFNPLDREPAFLQLGDKNYEVREATRGVIRRVSDLQKTLEAVDETDADSAVSIFAEIIACSIVDGDDAANAIRGLWNDDKLSLSALTRCVQFISEELQGSVTSGE